MDLTVLYVYSINKCLRFPDIVLDNRAVVNVTLDGTLGTLGMFQQFRTLKVLLAHKEERTSFTMYIAIWFIHLLLAVLIYNRQAIWAHSKYQSRYPFDTTLMLYYSV